MDDVWVHENSSYFDDDGNDIEHCVEYLCTLKQIDKKIYNSASNRSREKDEQYLETFGVTPICKQLAVGLITSLETISTSDASHAQNRIETAKKTLLKARKIARDLDEWEEKRQKIKESM